MDNKSKQRELGTWNSILLTKHGSPLVFTPDTWEQDVLWKLKRRLAIKNRRCGRSLPPPPTVPSYNPQNSHILHLLPLSSMHLTTATITSGVPKLLFLFGCSHWFLSAICASHFPSKEEQNLFLLWSGPAQARVRTAGGQFAGDVPISIPRAAVRVLNFLTSHLDVSLFAHRNVNKVEVSSPATLINYALECQSWELL